MQPSRENMNILAWFRSVTAKYLDRSRVESDLDDELRSHIEHRADDLERSGLPRAQAERRARIEFGGYQRVTEECHEARGGNFLAVVFDDVRFRLRVLRKSPGFTLVAVITLV